MYGCNKNSHITILKLFIPVRWKTQDVLAKKPL